MNYKIYDKNSDKLGELYLKCDLKYENYKAEMDKYDKYFYSKVDEMIEMNLNKTIKVANKTKDSILKISNKIESIAK